MFAEFSSFSYIYCSNILMTVCFFPKTVSQTSFTNFKTFIQLHELIQLQEIIQAHSEPFGQTDRSSQK